MRITVVGGTGLIGARLVRQLGRTGHEVVAAARATGVNSFTGEGLAAALDGADVVIDVSNSSYTDEAGAREFFYASTLNLLTYGAAAGVRHHVALSVVGTDRLARAQGGYFLAKAAQERLIVESGRPLLPRPRDAVLRVRPQHHGCRDAQRCRARRRRAGAADGGG